jgi:hypothetical protein
MADESQRAQRPPRGSLLSALLRSLPWCRCWTVPITTSQMAPDDGRSTHRSRNAPRGKIIKEPEAEGGDALGREGPRRGRVGLRPLDGAHGLVVEGRDARGEDDGRASCPTCASTTRSGFDRPISRSSSRRAGSLSGGRRTSPSHFGAMSRSLATDTALSCREVTELVTHELEWALPDATASVPSN